MAARECYPCRGYELDKSASSISRKSLRFPTLASADKLGLGHVAELGRFKVTAIMQGTGPGDLVDMMSLFPGLWTLDSVEIVGWPCHCFFPPKQSKYCLEQADGALVPMWIHALNAKELYKGQNTAIRRVDAEGEELETEEATAPAMSLDAKFQAPAASAKHCNRCKLPRKGEVPKRPTPKIQMILRKAGVQLLNCV